MGFFDNFKFGNSIPTLPTPRDITEMSMSFGAYQYPSLGIESLGARGTQYDLTNPRIIDTGKYVIFGNDNLYPNHLDTLLNASGLHHSIIEFKKSLITNGFEVEADSKLNPSDQLKLTTMISFFDGERSLSEVIDDLTLDLLVHNTMYLKIFWNEDKTKILKAVRIAPAKLRINTNKFNPDVVESYTYNFDWATGQYTNSEIPAFKAMSKNKVEILRFINKNPQANFYTLPTWSSGSNWIRLDQSVSEFQKASIDNGINPALVIKIPQDGTPEEKAIYMQKIKEQYQGSRNAGRTMIFFGNGLEQLPVLDVIQPADLSKTFTNTSESIQTNICLANQIDPLLVGLRVTGSLGNGTELPIAFEVFNKSVIQPRQKDIEGFINKVFRLNSLSANFELENVILFKPKDSTGEDKAITKN